MANNISTLKTWIGSSDNIVFFGGAGVSTESGVPDFRSVDGLYSQKYKYPPETIISHSFFEKHPQEFYEFYREKLIIDGIKPNPAHMALADLEAQGKLKAVITQNIDGLHQMAGSKNVLELHGSTLRNYCTKCSTKYGIEIFKGTTGVPKCNCGGTIRPDVVLYEEGLDLDIMTNAIECIRNADVLIIGGTSLVVYPAAGLIDYYKGSKLVLINKGTTPMDSRADLLISEKIGEVFSQI